jgi:hypothetical protein
MARFYENSVPYTISESSGFEYDEYTIELHDYIALEDDILNNYDTYLRDAKEAELDRATLPEINRKAVSTEIIARTGRDVASLMFVKVAEEQPEYFDSTTLAENSELFAEHAPGVGYMAGQIRRDKLDGILYRCITSHGAEHSDMPPSESNLWERIADPGDEWPDWFPASGKFDQWMLGSKCSYEGKRWTSNVNYNVWVPGGPGVYTWDEAS